jgi:hypothetical protein
LVELHPTCSQLHVGVFLSRVAGIGISVWARLSASVHQAQGSCWCWAYLLTRMAGSLLPQRCPLPKCQYTADLLCNGCSMYAGWQAAEVLFTYETAALLGCQQAADVLSGTQSCCHSPLSCAPHRPVTMKECGCKDMVWWHAPKAATMHTRNTSLMGRHTNCQGCVCQLMSCWCMR